MLPFYRDLRLPAPPGDRWLPEGDVRLRCVLAAPVLLALRPMDNVLPFPNPAHLDGVVGRLESPLRGGVRRKVGLGGRCWGRRRRIIMGVNTYHGRVHRTCVSF